MIALGVAGLLALTSATFADSATNAPTTLSGTPIGDKAQTNFWRRLYDAEVADLATSAVAPPSTNAPAPPANRRGNPPPFDSPPFPGAEWQIGGTETIGDPNLTIDFPLMEALYAGPHGLGWSDSRIKFYGWEDFSGNVSTSHAAGLSPFGNGNNYPEVYDQRSDRFEENQLVLYIERTPDEFQTDHLDWGFRFSQIYGLDYRYMVSRGWGDGQYTRHNEFYGTDNPMMYVNVYVPKVAEGWNITLGRIISVPDIEAQLAPNNLMSSHSLLYGSAPFCQWGLFNTIKLNTNWVIQLGLSAGNDVTFWETQDPGCQPTGNAMVQYQSDNNKFGFYGGANCVNNSHWGFNDIQQYVGTLTYRFTDKIWTAHETWWMYQTESPGQTGGPGSRFGHPVRVLASDEPLNENGGLGYTGGSIPVHPGWAAEWATLNYTMYRLGANTFLTLRNEVFDDEDGQRTGFATIYSEHSLGVTWWPDKLITIRPEIRYDHSYGGHGTSIDPMDEAKPFDNGTRRNQFTAQFDVIYRF